MLAGPVSKAIASPADAPAAQQRDVRDAAEVERDAILPGARQKQRIDAGNQRRPVTSGSRIGAAKIVTYGRGDRFPNHEGVAELKREMLRAVVPERLPVRGDEVDRLAERDLAGGGGVRAPERVVQARGRFDRSGLRRHRGKQRLAKRGVERTRAKPHERERVAFAARGDLDERRIDAVERGSAH